jgi:hypothetical protein
MRRFSSPARYDVLAQTLQRVWHNINRGGRQWLGLRPAVALVAGCGLVAAQRHTTLVQGMCLGGRLFCRGSHVSSVRRAERRAGQACGQFGEGLS